MTIFDIYIYLDLFEYIYSKATGQNLGDILDSNSKNYYELKAKTFIQWLRKSSIGDIFDNMNTVNFWNYLNEHKFTVDDYYLYVNMYRELLGTLVTSPRPDIFLIYDSIKQYEHIILKRGEK